MKREEADIKQICKQIPMCQCTNYSIWSDNVGAVGPADLLFRIKTAIIKNIFVLLSRMTSHTVKQKTV